MLTVSNYTVTFIPSTLDCGHLQQGIMAWGGALPAYKKTFVERLEVISMDILYMKVK